MGAPFPNDNTIAQKARRRMAWAPHFGALLLVLAALAGFSVTAQAQDVAPAEGDEAEQRRIFIPASADSYVSNLATADNFGSEQSLLVSGGGTLVSIFTPSLVRFDLSMLPAGTTIHAATLRLNQISAGGDGAALSLPISYITGNWDEATVNFADRPSQSATGLSVNAPTADNVVVDTDVTSIVQTWQTGTPPNFGLYINPVVAGGQTRSRTFVSREGASAQRPMLIIDYTLPRIHVCLNQDDTCPSAPSSRIYNLTTGAIYTTDANGIILPADLEGVGLGNRLWAMMPVTTTNGGTLYYTQGEAEVVAATSFNFYGNFYEMRLVVEQDRPLYVQDLEISAQWYVRSNVAQATKLRDDILATSEYLHAFSDGQFALGTVRVQQNYDGWGAADMQLYANNTQRPRAIIGGVVGADTPDFDLAVPITYTPGVVSMGSYWNRFGTPPNSSNTQGGAPVTEAEMAQDWPLAFGHELGHWLLYLFDTYTGIDGNASAELAELCTGTAMGNVYLPTNHGYIFSPDDWVARCGETEAYARLAGRTEWATIQGWYAWATVPADFVPDDYDLPAAITQVIFVEPSIPPGAASAQLFNLEYQDDELSSGEARAFLLRDERVLEQGKPAKNSTQVQLTGAEVGDLLCVYDINDHAEGAEMPRHQFGCETIVAGDDTLIMTKDVQWSPEIALLQVGPNQLQVSVDAALSGPAADALTLRLFPEHESGMTPVVLPRIGDVYSSTITLPASVPPLYAQVFVDETPAAPQTRREVIADRGTGGGGAYGPARFYGDVLVMSSDGNASYQNSDLTELEEGESIAFQSMPGTPPLPFPLRIIGQSYRLDAFPASLVTEGSVSLRYTDSDLLAASAAGAGDAPAIWFWDGATWSPLATSTIEPVNAADGVRVATAPSEGVGVYAVLVPADPASNRFLPLIVQ